MTQTKQLASMMLESAASVMGRLLERKSELGDVSRSDRTASVRTDAGYLVTLAELPSVGAQFVVRFATTDMQRVVAIMLGGGDEGGEMGAMQLSIASESVSQIATAMAEKLANEIGAAADGVRAELCNEPAALPPPPFETYEATISSEGGLTVKLGLDIPAIAVSRLGLTSVAASEPSAEAVRLEVAKASEAPTTAAAPAGRKAPTTEVKSATFTQLTPTQTRPAAPGHANLDFVHDVPLQVSAVLGKTVMALRDVVSLQTGSVFELDKEAVEPVDLYVNNILIARGEVVVVDDKYAVKISELNPQVG